MIKSPIVSLLNILEANLYSRYSIPPKETVQLYPKRDEIKEKTLDGYMDLTMSPSLLGQYYRIWTKIAILHNLNNVTKVRK